jgi:hypothetical protein
MDPHTPEDGEGSDPRTRPESTGEPTSSLTPGLRDFARLLGRLVADRWRSGKRRSPPSPPTPTGPASDSSTATGEGST